MNSETKRIKNENDLIKPGHNELKSSNISNTQQMQQPSLVFYQNIQNPQQQGFQQFPVQQYIINQPIFYQQPYAQPVIINSNQQNIINNQVLPTITPIKWTIHPRLIVCPFCMKNIKTKVEEKFNYVTLCFWIIFLILLPLALFAALAGGATCGQCTCDCCCSKKKEEKEEEKEEEKKEDIEVIEKRDKCCCISCCYDGTHYCPECGKVLGESKTCF